MSTLSEVGKLAMCTYHVRGRNEKIVASMYLTSESILRIAKIQGSFLHDPTTIITTSSMKHLGDRSSGYFTAFPAICITLK